MMPSPTDGPTTGNQELYKYLWYHGNLLRPKTESLLVNDGNFLVRDSTSRPGDYVLSCCWRGSPLHFVLNRLISTDEAGQTQVQFQLEDAVFDRVSELVQYYIANKKPISAMSGAIICSPVNRTAHQDGFDPYRGYGGDLAKSNSMKFASRSQGDSPKASPRPSPFVSPSSTPTHSPPVSRKIILPKRTGSQPLSEPHYQQSNVVHTGSAPPTPQQNQSKSEQLSAVSSQSPLSRRKYMSTQSNLRGSASSLSDNVRSTVLPLSDSVRSTASSLNDSVRSTASSLNDSVRSTVSSLNDSVRSTASSLNDSVRSTASSVSDHLNTPPPKPSRLPSVKYLDKRPVIGIRNRTLYEDDGKDYTDYEQVKAWPEALERERANKKTNNDSQKSETEKIDQSDNEAHVESDSDDDYDNNFDTASKMVGEADYDMPKAGVGKTPTSGGDIYDVPKEAKRVSDSDHSGIGSDVLNSSFEKDSNAPEGDEEFSEPTKLPKYRITLPDLEDVKSCFDLLNFSSANLPPENKPLEGATMSTIKALFMDGEAKVLSEHITKVDLEVLKVIGRHDLGVGVFSGLELITLPQGHQLRQDAIERSDF